MEEKKMEEKKEFDWYEYNSNYIKEHYDKVLVLVPRGSKKELLRIAKEKGISLSKYVLENKLILKSKPKVKTETEPGNFNAYKYINNFQKNNYDRITVIIPKGIKKELVEKAKKSKKTLSRYVLENIIE